MSFDNMQCLTPQMYLSITDYLIPQMCICVRTVNAIYLSSVAPQPV